MTVRTRELTIGKRLEAIDPGHSWTRKPTFRSSIFRLRHERPVRSTAGGRNHGIAAPRVISPGVEMVGVDPARVLLCPSATRASRVA